MNKKLIDQEGVSVMGGFTYHLHPSWKRQHVGDN